MAIASAILFLRSSQPKTALLRLQNTWKSQSQGYPIHQRKRLSATEESKELLDHHWANSAPSCLCCSPNNPRAKRLRSISQFGIRNHESSISGRNTNRYAQQRKNSRGSVGTAFVTRQAPLSKRISLRLAGR